MSEKKCLKKVFLNSCKMLQQQKYNLRFNTSMKRHNDKCEGVGNSVNFVKREAGLRGKLGLCCGPTEVYNHA